MADILIGTATTDVNGLAAFTNLAPGTYKYVQSTARTGYTADPTQYTITVTNATPVTADRSNLPTESGSITITKHALGYPAVLLSGATFKLTDSAGKTMQAVTAASDAVGEIKLTNLMSITGTPQTYKLLEVTPPANYNLNTAEFTPSVTVITNTPQAVPNTPTVAGALDVTLTDTNYNEYGLTGADYDLYLVTP